MSSNDEETLEDVRGEECYIVKITFHHTVEPAFGSAWSDITGRSERVEQYRVILAGRLDRHRACVSVGPIFTPPAIHAVIGGDPLSLERLVV